MCPIWAHFRAKSWAQLKFYFMKQIKVKYLDEILVVLVKMFETEIHGRKTFDLEFC